VHVVADRVSDGDEHATVRQPSQRQRGQPASGVGGEQRCHVVLGLELVRLGVRELVLLGEDVGQLLRRHEPAVDEDLAQLVADEALVHQRCLEVVLGDETRADEHRAEGRPVEVGGFHIVTIGRGRAVPERRENAVVRVVVQRVSEASVAVDGDVVASCGPGLLVLVGVAVGDDEAAAARLAAKVARLRIFADEDGRFDRSLVDVRGEALVVSQFTLLADSTRQKGTRPDFSQAARPEVAEPLYERFCEALRELGVPVRTGVFGARMQVTLVNDGPVTIVLDVDPQRTGRSS
jgi:D-tyrosyl-tRNA(Tyr) deacylase